MLVDVVVPIATGLTGLITGVVAASWRAGLELAVRYDIELRGKRLAAYRELWGLLATLAFHSPPRPVTFIAIRELSVALREWYFDEGGLLMARSSQRKFLQLQRLLAPGAGDQPDGEVPQRELKKMRDVASDLRTKMTRDIASRRGSLLGRDRFTR